MASAHEIELNDAVVLTKRFKDRNALNTKRGFWMDRSAIEELLNQTNPTCEGIRVYLGMDEDNGDELTIVIVATDNEMNDITDKVMNRALKCPNDCSSNSPL